MKIVIAADSFKGSLSSIEAGRAIAEGIKRADAQAQVIVRPVADGGEGTVDALVQGMNGRMQSVPVTGPLGTPVNCCYGILGDGVTEVMEMAEAAGITLVPKENSQRMYNAVLSQKKKMKEYPGVEHNMPPLYSRYRRQRYQRRRSRNAAGIRVWPFG